MEEHWRVLIYGLRSIITDLVLHVEICIRIHKDIRQTIQSPSALRQ